MDGTFGFQAREASAAGERFTYRVRPPPGGARGAPVLLFLHGAGERGRDGARQLTVGLPPRVAAAPDDWPFLVVAPQCPEGRFWPEPAPQALALAALEDAVLAHSADGSRVAVTGISMGGYGTLELALRRPGRFRALAVICGGLAAIRAHPALHAHLARAAADPYAETARRLAGVPTWLFHGADDEVVPVTESRRLDAALRAGGGDVRYTEYPGVGHDAWGRAYADPALSAWLRGQV